MKLTSLITKSPVIKEATTISIETAAKKLQKMTDNNQHSETVLELAKLLFDKKYQKIAQAIIDIHDAEGSMPVNLVKYREEIRNKLLDKIKSKFSKEDYDRIASSM